MTYAKSSAGARPAGLAGVMAFVLTVPTIALYFVYPAEPPMVVVLARVVINAVLCCFLLVFVTALSGLVTQSRSGWLALPLAGVGTAFVVVTLVANAVEAGAVLHAGRSIDPTLMGSGAEASQVIYSPIARLLTATFLLLAAAAARSTAMLPSGLAYVAIGVAVFHLALVPTAFSTTDPSRFYSLNGWSIPIAGGLFLMWVLAAGISLLVRRPVGDGPRTS